MGETLQISCLLLLNGPPGIGKTTPAERYVADHPVTLNLDIDTIRCSMGQWECAMNRSTAPEPSPSPWPACTFPPASRSPRH